MTADLIDAHGTARRTAALLGPVGVWSGKLAAVEATDARAAAVTIERLGYGALWIGETPRIGREALSHAGILLAATEQLIVATGIANIWLRQAAAIGAAAHTLAEAYPDRFVLGVGASHAAALSLVGRDYDKPLTAMRNYLVALAEATYLGPQPTHPVPVVVAALRPKMQALARDRADGMHSFFVTPVHTAAARQSLGPGPLLIPEQAVVVHTDPDRARQRARAHVRTRLALPNYVNHLAALGYTEDDLTDCGSDALIDDLVAWGDPPTVAGRVREHLAAGADHVAIHPLDTDEDPLGLDQLAAIATFLGGVGGVRTTRSR